MTDTITITGNLAAEPEQRVLPGGTTVTNFRVGSTHRRYDKASDQWVDEYTNWYAVSAYRSLGDHAFASLHKGHRVIVSGRLRLREWDNGTKKGLAVEIDADAVGHDLLWGMTTFQKDGAARMPAPTEAQAGAEAETDQAASSPPAAPPAPTDSDGWTIPAASAAEPALVETPF